MTNSLKSSSALVPFLVRLSDAALILMAGYMALHVRRILDLPVQFPVDLSGYYALMAVGALLFAVVSGDVARSWRGAQMPVMLAKVAGRWLTVVGLLLLWLFAFKASQEFSRVWFAVWIVFSTLLLWLGRFGVYLVLRNLRLRGVTLRQVALVGEGAVAENLQQRVSSAGWSGYKITMVIPHADTASLESLANSQIDEVWLALPLADVNAIQRILHALRHSAASIRLAPDLFTLRLINHGVSEVLGVSMYDLSTSPMTGMNQFVKWAEDKLLSALILLLISPVMLAVAIGVKLSSRGPVFYRQERVGLNNRPFAMLKFRSMPVDVEKDGVRWGGAATKTTSRFGQFIRKTSLDELPQFINVLKGDMSIVGPRPERSVFVEQFKDEIPDYMKKHLVKAGITGWAQIHGLRGDTDLKMRIEYDLFYIENWSFWLDLKIIFLTVFKGFVNKNAY